MESLRSFISAALQSPLAIENDIITVVARSAESPVARALVQLGAEIAGSGRTVRAIFAHLEPEKTDAGWSVSGPRIAFARDLRWAKNPRLADAHEQLVLGGTTCWIGDCLRRDPSRRDAYEHYLASDATTARTMRISFERLWTASEPLLIRSPSNKTGPSPSANVASDDLAGLLPRDGNPGPLASSPH